VLYWHGQREPGADTTFVPLRELFETSDIVSVHLPITTETERLVDEAALVDALASGHPGAAGLDVVAALALPRDRPLLGLSNVVLSLGVARRTPEALRRALAVAVENARRLRDARRCCTGSPELRCL
jgi:phosphoglycerate dehydrogenase-like enzyme